MALRLMGQLGARQRQVELGLEEGAVHPVVLGELQIVEIRRGGRGVWTAATGDTTQLRYLAGDGARAVLCRGSSPEQDEAFVTALRAQLGP